MPYTHLPMPVWARAVTGGVVLLVVALGIFVQAILRSEPGALPLVPVLALEVFFVVLAALLVGYGIHTRGRTA